MTKSGCVNYSRWMTDLPEELKNLPFIYIIIPGSHNSMTFNIKEEGAQASPDGPDFLRSPHFKKCFPDKLRDSVLWMRMQNANITEQLEHGIRYFDLRFAYKDGTNDIFFAHYFYAGEVTEQLELIKQFLDQNESEVVILDCQYFYFDKNANKAFEKKCHKKLLTILADTFGSKICPPREDFNSLTLNFMNVNNYQVIIVYRDLEYSRRGYFWNENDFLSVCPKKKTVDALREHVYTSIKPLAKGFVTHLLLTPELPFMVKNFGVSDIKQFSADPVSEKLLPCIYSLTPILPTQVQCTKNKRIRMNVVVTDFVDMNYYRFPKKILKLNNKLLKELEEIKKAEMADENEESTEKRKRKGKYCRKKKN